MLATSSFYDVLLFSRTKWPVNYLYSFWYICYYRQSTLEKAQFVCWQKEAAVKDCVQSPPAQHQRNGFVFVYKRWSFQTWYGGWWNAVFRQHDGDGFSLAIRDHLASAFLANWWRHVCCMRQLTRLWSCHIICATNMKNDFVWWHRHSIWIQVNHTEQCSVSMVSTFSYSLRELCDVWLAKKKNGWTTDIQPLQKTFQAGEQYVKT